VLKQLVHNLQQRRRRLDVDLRALRSTSIDEDLDGLICIIEHGRVSRVVPRLIRLVLLQALTDRAIAIHLFLDPEDLCIRMLYCLAVPPEAKMCPRTPSSLINVDTGIREDAGVPGDIVWPDPARPDYERVWYEMVPPPACASDELFRRLRWHAGLRRGAAEGRLLIRYEGRDHHADAIAPTPDDFRIYFTPERPPIRPKLVRHFRELGMAVPNE
jgi:hypothetical protein